MTTLQLLKQAFETNPMLITILAVMGLVVGYHWRTVIWSSVLFAIGAFLTLPYFYLVEGAAASNFHNAVHVTWVVLLLPSIFGLGLRWIEYRLR
jgi:hypothetical protein